MFRFAEIFTDHMVLQRDGEIRVFGTGDEPVTVTFRGIRTEASVKDGHWEALLPPCPAGGPYELTAATNSESITLTDILVGDVWIASGQSNMEFPLLFDLRGVEAAEHAADPKIRLYTCSRATRPEKEKYTWAFEKVTGDYTPWQVCNEQSALHFCAIGYYVAMLVRKKVDIPIGIISANKGGTPIDTFVPEEMIETEHFKGYRDWYQKTKLPDEEAEERFDEYYEKFVVAADNNGVTMEELVRKLGVEAAVTKGLWRPFPDLAMCKYHPNAPSVLYNRFLRDQIAPMAVKGVLWYQGESSRTDRNYADKFRIMANSWRKVLRQEELPFYTVEIAPYEYHDLLLDAAYLRAEQWRAAEITKNTHIVTTQDLGEEWDIHPNRKYEVSKRLATQILHYTYGIENSCEAPSLASYEIADGRIYLKLKNDEGFYGRDVSKNMMICGADGVYVPAESVYENGKLVVWNGTIKEPKHARYCFACYYRRGAYYNKAGLPLAPFTTELV